VLGPDGFGEIEESDVFALAEVLRAEELRQADNVCAFAGGFADAVRGLVEVRVGVGAAGHLHQTDSIVGTGRHVSSLSSLLTNTYTSGLFQDREKAQAPMARALDFFSRPYCRTQQIRYAS